MKIQENTKEYGRLSIIASWKMYNKKIMDIDPKYFYPKPKVWSSLMVHTPKSKIENLITGLSNTDTHNGLRVIHRNFAQIIELNN